MLVGNPNYWFSNANAQILVTAALLIKAVGYLRELVGWVSGHI